MAKRKSSKSRKSLNFQFTFATLAILIAVIGVVYIFGKNSGDSQRVLASENKYQKELSPKTCQKSGNPVINVTQQIDNTIDSGEAGNYWAYDDIERHIQVWKIDESNYCAIVKYNGQFDGQAGERSPGDTGYLTGIEDGTMHGGYRATINGVLLENPELSANGSIGLTDYNCDISTGVCPGGFDWTTKYFNTEALGFSFSYDWWGWIYKNGNKVWVNSSDGNSGDIF